MKVDWHELFMCILYGAGAIASIAFALFLFGCVMCALFDNHRRPDQSPWLARAIGGVIVVLSVLASIGWLVRLL